MKQVVLPNYYKDILYALADIELESSKDKSSENRERIVQRLAHELVTQSLTPSQDMIGHNPTPRMATPEEFYLLNPTLDNFIKKYSESTPEYEHTKRLLRGAITTITQVYLKLALRAQVKQRSRDLSDLKLLATAQYAPLQSGEKDSVKEHNKQVDVFRYYRLFIGIAISSSLIPLFNLDVERLRAFMRFVKVHDAPHGELRKKESRLRFIKVMAANFTNYFMSLDILAAFKKEFMKNRDEKLKKESKQVKK